MERKFFYPIKLRILGLKIKALLAGRENVTGTLPNAGESQLHVAGGLQIQKSSSGRQLFEAGFDFDRQKTSGDQIPGIKIE